MASALRRSRPSQNSHGTSFAPDAAELANEELPAEPSPSLARCRPHRASKPPAWYDMEARPAIRLDAHTALAAKKRPPADAKGGGVAQKRGRAAVAPNAYATASAADEAETEELQALAIAKRPHTSPLSPDRLQTNADLPTADAVAFPEHVQKRALTQLDVSEPPPGSAPLLDGDPTKRAVPASAVRPSSSARVEAVKAVPRSAVRPSESLPAAVQPKSSALVEVVKAVPHSAVRPSESLPAAVQPKSSALVEVVKAVPHSAVRPSESLPAAVQPYKKNSAPSYKKRSSLDDGQRPPPRAVPIPLSALPCAVRPAGSALPPGSVTASPGGVTANFPPPAPTHAYIATVAARPLATIPRDDWLLRQEFNAWLASLSPADRHAAASRDPSNVFAIPTAHARLIDPAAEYLPAAHPIPPRGPGSAATPVELERKPSGTCRR